MRDLSTILGGPRREFPPTRWSVVLAAGQTASPQRDLAFETLARLYWRPIYAYFRRRWDKPNEEAKDLAQEFFLYLAEHDTLQHLSKEGGRFRSYVKAALDNWVRQDFRDQSRLKRGGEARFVPIEEADTLLPAVSDSPEKAFLREWARSILEDSLREVEEDFRSRGKESAFQVFRLHDVDTPPDEDLSYEALGRRFGLTVSEVTHALFNCRKKLCETAWKRVEDTVTSGEEARLEMREILEELSK